MPCPSQSSSLPRSQEITQPESSLPSSQQPGNCRCFLSCKSSSLSTAIGVVTCANDALLSTSIPTVKFDVLFHPYVTDPFTFLITLILLTTLSLK